MSWKRLRFIKNHFEPVIKGGIGFVLGATTGGIFGNRADALFLLLLPFVSKLAVTIYCSWIITIIAVLVSLIVAWAWLYDKEDLSRKAHEKSQLFDLDTKLLRLLPSLICTPNLDTEMHKFMQRSLDIITQSFSSKVRRSLLLLPDAEREYLTIRDGHGWMDEDSKNQKKFYIGSQKAGMMREGVAGEAFKKLEVIVAHITVEDGHYKSDKDSYISFDATPPSHRSLACVPIIAGVNDCLGIISFESNNPTAFDAPETRDVLLLLGRYTAAALLMYQGLQKASESLKAKGSNSIKKVNLESINIRYIFWSSPLIEMAQRKTA